MIMWVIGRERLIEREIAASLLDAIGTQKAFRLKFVSVFAKLLAEICHAGNG